MSNMNKDAPGSRPEGAEAQAGAFDSTGRTHIRRIYEKAEAHSKLERICLIDRHRHYRQAKSARRRNTTVSALLQAGTIQTLAKKAKSLRNNLTRGCGAPFCHVGRLHHPR